MLALLIIPILVSGYIMITANQYHYFRLYRHEGQLLYMKVAALGTFCLVAAVIIAAGVKYCYPDFRLVSDMINIFKVTSKPEIDRVYMWLILLSATSICFSLLYVSVVWVKDFIRGCYYKREVYNDITQAMRARVLRKTYSQGSRDILLLDAIESVPKRPMLLTLSSNKVYVGLINGAGEPTENQGPHQHISFVPLMSGYRHKENLSVTFTNAYPGEIQVKRNAAVQGVSKRKVQGLEIMISIDEISYISWFDFQVYQATNNKIESRGHVIGVTKNGRNIYRRPNKPSELASRTSL
ncbi:hypothetical protein J5069_11915 [Candidatus Symbiopectobacterium sp. NZEC127]|uniref:hypothetical protein n=1 Tax=Candidatus Symbiopectobacterium sp. NZEC127 TaxID=2820472 RepID=UPI00222764D1|nr:hypothetical protein [Candidatus Symbiopectobacterium sp. NZEC127]MCW2486597.1 hypothetical protein [Candidatus Symbiopectobacterium sp. NZEC127]